MNPCSGDQEGASDYLGSEPLDPALVDRFAVILEVGDWEQLSEKQQRLIADPGVGFGKNLTQNLALIRRLGELASLGYPLLFGPSRKGFIGKALDGLPPEERLEGTLASSILAIDRGVDILRVHDVKATAGAARLADAVVRA